MFKKLLITTLLVAGVAYADSAQNCAELAAKIRKNAADIQIGLEQAGVKNTLAGLATQNVASATVLALKEAPKLLPLKAKALQVQADLGLLNRSCPAASAELRRDVSAMVDLALQLVR